MKTIKFKSSSAVQDVRELELPYETGKKFADYKEDLAKQFCCDPLDLKLIYKGRIIPDEIPAEEAHITEGSLVIVVISAKKSPPKKTLTSQQQAVPGAGMTSGQGGAMPFGFGGYGMVNHPEYMKAISSSVDPEQLDHMLDDPHTQGMIEQMMNDPDTLKYLLEQNPSTKGLMQSNPFLKMIIENPELRKQFFNPETMKLAKQMAQKNPGGMSMMPFGAPGQPTANNQMLPNPMLFSTQANQFQPTQNPFMAMQNPLMAMQNPLFRMNYPTMPMQNPILSMPNPLFSMNTVPSTIPNLTTNAMVADEQKYKSQLEELWQMGFKDRAKNLLILKQTGGDVDAAIEKLCSD